MFHRDSPFRKMICFYFTRKRAKREMKRLVSLGKEKLEDLHNISVNRPDTFIDQLIPNFIF